MKEKENWIKAARFERPAHIPVGCNINQSCWGHYTRSFLWEMVASHPAVFPWFANADDKERKHIENPVFRPDSIVGKPYIDPWGCLWETSENGIVGTVTKHPLGDWESFKDFKSPDPDKSNGMFPVDWSALSAAKQVAALNGELFMTGLPHGHTFLRLCDLRNYENLIFDMVDEQKELSDLIKTVKNFNLAVLERQLRLSPDVISIPEDLGMQKGPMLSPEQFKTFILPCYEEYVKVVREKSDALVHMHSDGDIRTLADGLIRIGIDILNLQDLVNGLDWIEKTIKGRVCIDLDIDRQNVTCFGSPSEIDALIRNEVTRLGSREGGLMMMYGLYPGVPEKNVKAILDAMEKYAFHFS